VSEMKVRGYEKRDIPAILALERACAEAPQWGEAFWRNGFPGDAALRGVFVAEIAERVCGYSVVAIAVDIGELQSVVVSERVRRNGMGLVLCERAMEWARKKRAKSVELEVRESNAAALSLYRRLGFVEQVKRPKYYKDPVEDAVLMTAKL
jgi:[ribosomal protein S18]-alanine N-acetyltransferase